MERAHELEHEGDEVNHAIFKTVATDFITPIEREDITVSYTHLDVYKRQGRGHEPARRLNAG